MDEKLRAIWKNKYMMWGHLFFNLILMVHSFMYIFDGTPFQITKYCVFLVIIAFCAILEFANWKSSVELLEEKWIGKVYYIIRPASSVVYCFMSEDKLEGSIFLALIIFGMSELVLHIAIDSLARRVWTYIIFSISYGVVSIVMLVSLVQQKESAVTLPIAMRECAVVFVVMAIIVFFGESLSAMWNSFEKQLFKQNRVLEELNKANDILQEQQDKINRVNEKLGMQKIELQAANKRINRSHDEMSVQNEISSIIVSTTEKEDMLIQIANTMQVRLDMDAVAIILEERQDLKIPGEEPKGRFVALSTSLGKKFEEQLLQSVHTTGLSEMLAMNQTYIKNSQTESVKLFRCLDGDYELTSIICLPIISQEERLATLVVGKNRINAFMDGRAFYENIASQLSVGINNARLYEKMNDMAIRDGLTRIYNRRHLSDLLTEYLNEAIAKKMSVSLALFDIDKFKMVNDTYGHQCGDEVIRYVATLLNKGAIKYGGIAGRYGGEEFVIAFLNKDVEETYEIVEEIHSQIKNEEVVFEEKHIRVTASAGLASYPKTCANPSELLTRADWAMYHSKRNGRDQITIDSNQIEDKM